MKLLNFLFKNKRELTENLTISFPNSVEKAIQNISNTNEELDDNTLFKLLLKVCTNEFEAKEIYIFLPIAFAKLWLHNLKWHETYIEITANGKETEKRYDESDSFRIIFEVSQKYFQNNPSRETIIKIGGRSAEINAVNQLILDGGKLEDVELTKTTIIK